MARGRAINNAWQILVELTASLKKEEAPELSARLGGLYVYMQGQLLQANLKQQDAPLAEVLSLLTTLSEAWDGVSDSAAKPQASTPAPSNRNRWSQGVGEEPVRIALSA
jgi:flagellar protein FliS